MLKLVAALIPCFLLLPFVNSQLSGELYQGCGDTKGCVGEVQTCVQDQTCNYLLTYVKVEEEDAYSFQYTALVPDGEEYIATGLSLDGGSGSMSNDSVVACYAGEDLDQNDEDFVHMYWNVDHDSLPLEEERLGLSEANGEFVDDTITCSFVRDAITTIINPEDNLEYTIDLNNQPYYVQFVRGPLEEEGIIGFHEDYHPGEVLVDFTIYSTDDVTTDNPTDNPTDYPTYDDCFELKGCFGTSEDCVESQDCASYTTYTVNNDGSVTFIMTGEVTEDSYISFGLSETEEMFDAIVMYCYTGIDSSVEVSTIL